MAESSANSNYSLADDQDDDRRGCRLRRLLAAAEPADRKSFDFVRIVCPDVTPCLTMNEERKFKLIVILK